MGTDITTDLVFGKTYDLLTKPDLRPAANAIPKSLKRNGLVFYYPALFRQGSGHWLDISTWILPNTLQLIMTLIGLGTQSALERIQKQSSEKQSGDEKSFGQRKDILSYLINGTDPETGTAFTPTDIIAEANVLLISGGDAMGIAMCGIFFYLSRNRHAYDKLAAEIRTTFHSRSELGLGPKLSSCTYLRACIEEGQRLVGGPAFWREAGPGGATVCGEYIPPGYEAGICMRAINHNAEYFPSPFSYEPERWLSSVMEPAEQERLAVAKAAHNPFSLGPRGCVAKNLGLTVMELTLATLIWEMDFRVAEGPAGRTGEGGPGLGFGRERKDEFQLYGNFTMTKDGPVLQFRKRETE
jgi:hypothetical protein